eukprot:scaffold59178_cov62-Phaeocystis_antarctica.AAC.2
MLVTARTAITWLGLGARVRVRLRLSVRARGGAAITAPKNTTSRTCRHESVQAPGWAEARLRLGWAGLRLGCGWVWVYGRAWGCCAPLALTAGAALPPHLRRSSRSTRPASALTASTVAVMPLTIVRSSTIVSFGSCVRSELGLRLRLALGLRLVSGLRYGLGLRLGSVLGLRLGYGLHLCLQRSREDRVAAPAELGDRGDDDAAGDAAAGGRGRGSRQQDGAVTGGGDGRGRAHAQPRMGWLAFRQGAVLVTHVCKFSCGTRLRQGTRVLQACSESST